jgi:hypothetical protein
VSRLVCLVALLLALNGWALAAAPPLATTPGRITAPRFLHVGKNQEFATVSAAAAAAKDGDVVEIEAGDYWRDVAVWTQRKLILRGVNSRVRLLAGGAAAEAKAIWVFRDGDFRVENIDFIGTKVGDKNGAGIRFEKGHLAVVNCGFFENEMGLLTSNDKKAALDVENSEFARNGYRDDANHHNLYVGGIARLSVVGSYFHHARQGHLFKSRARENYVYYNRFTDELGGEASYEMEFPNGGLAYVVGNIVQQGNGTENPYLISYGVEGYVWPRNELYLVNNTLADDKARDGRFLRVSPGAQVVKAINNLLIGQGELDSGRGKQRALELLKSARAYVLGEAGRSISSGPAEYSHNFHAEWSDVTLAPRYDYRLKANSPLVGKAVDPGEANGVKLRPGLEYVHPRSTRPIAVSDRLDPGAFQTVAP